MLCNVVDGTVSTAVVATRQGGGINKELSQKRAHGVWLLASSECVVRNEWGLVIEIRF